MKMKLDFSIGKLFQNKKFAIIFSIVAAFIFWLVIIINQTPNIERTIVNVPVTIDATGTVAGELGLDEVSGSSHRTVSVRVSGPAYIVGNLTAEDILVSPSLANVTAPGEYDLTLNASKNSFAAEYSILSITPAELTLTFDYIDTKEFTVIPMVVGASAVEGLVAQAPVISNSNETTITVKGARSLMQKLDSVTAFVQVNETLSKTTTYEAEIILSDKDGNKLDATKYSLSKNKVNISVPISKTKTVYVVPMFKNAPANYGDFLKYSLSNSEVTIIGPAETIDSIQNIELSQLDFSEISTANNSFDLTPVLPDGVKILDNIPAITLKIDTASFRERTFTVSEYLVINNPSNYTVSLNNSIKNVKICGLRKTINATTANDLVAYIDLTGKSPGDYTVNVIISSKTNASIWQIGSYQASIKIK